MNILIITLTDDPFDPPGESRYGGAQRFMFDLGRYLVRRGHHVVFMTRQSRSRKPLHQKLGSRCEVRRFAIGPPHELTHHELFQFRAEVESNAHAIVEQSVPFDAVLSFNWLSGLAASTTGIHPHVHHILSLGRVRLMLHEQPHPSDDVRDRGEIEVFTLADRLICVCRDELESLKSLYPEIDASKGHIIPYGIDQDVFYRSPSDADDYVRRSSERFQKRD